MRKLYFDFNSTTPCGKEVQRVIIESLTNNWANPSSSYSDGRKAKEAIENARSQVAQMINAQSEEITFTSGGTESNNWVIESIIRSSKVDYCHIISTKIEHDSIKECISQHVEGSSKSSAVLKCAKDYNGAVSVDQIIDDIRPTTCLISVILANNETGVIQPIREIGLILRDINVKRIKKGLPKIWFHTDAAQAIGKIGVDVEYMCVDYLTIVGHKFYGPRIGALYHRKGAPLVALFFGGKQENSLRPGTENTPMIMGLGKAAELVINNLHSYQDHFVKLKNYFKEKAKTTFGDSLVINCSDAPHGLLPNTLSIAFNNNNVTGKKLLENQDLLVASLGAACHSFQAFNTITKGHISSVLIDSGVSEYLAERTIRISFGRETNLHDIDSLLKFFEEKLCFYNYCSKIKETSD